MYLNLVELAESLGVPEREIEDWIRSQGLPHISDRGRLLFDRAAVAEWAAERGLTARAGFLAREPDAVARPLRLEPMLRMGGIWRDVPSGETIRVLEQVLERIPRLSPELRGWLMDRLRAPGGIHWAPVGRGIALPHFSTRVSIGPDNGIVSLVFLADPLKVHCRPADDAPLTRLLFFIPPSPRGHLELLGLLTRALQSPRLADLLRNSAPDSEILNAFAAFDERPASMVFHSQRAP